MRRVHEIRDMKPGRTALASDFAQCEFVTESGALASGFAANPTRVMAELNLPAESSGFIYLVARVDCAFECSREGAK